MCKQLGLVFIFMYAMLSGSLAFSQESNERNGEVRYISDDLFTYLHAGPGRNYRILGTVIAGSRVMMLQEDEENGYTEVIDDKERTGWVQSDYINKTSSVRELIPGLQQSLQEAEAQLNQKEANDDVLNQQIAELKSQNNILTRKLKEVEAENATIAEELAQQDQSEQIEWFTRGGILAVISLVLGIVITYLPKKRRRNDTWM